MFNAWFFFQEEYTLETYLLDHTHPSSDNNSLTAILYGELGSTDFTAKHKILAGYADKGLINYVVRWNVKVIISQLLCLAWHSSMIVSWTIHVLPISLMIRPLCITSLYSRH